MKKRKFLKYISSYLLIIIVPIVFVCLFFYISVVKVIYNQTQLNRLSSLDKARVSLETQIAPITSMEQQVIFSNDLKSFRLSEYPLMAVDIMEMFSHHRLLNSAIIDIIYFQLEDHYVLTSQTSATTGAFYSHVYRFSDIDRQNFEDKLSEKKVGFLFLNDKVTINDIEENELVAYFVPLTSGTIDRNIVFMIDKHIFTDTLPKGANFSCIADEEGTILIKSENFADDFKLPINDLSLQSQPSNQMETVIDNEKYFITVIHSEKYNWYYMVFDKVSTLYTDVNHLLWIMAVIVGMSLVLGLIVLTYQIRHQFMPMQEAALTSEQLLPQSGSKKNDIYKFKEVMEYLDEQNVMLEKRAEHYEADAKEMFYLRLFHSRWKSEETLRLSADDLGISALMPFYTIAVLELNDEDAFAYINDILKTQIPPRYKLLVYPQKDFRRVLIAIGSQDNNYSHIPGLFNAVCEALKEKKYARFCIGVGGSTSDLMQWKIPLDHALQALEYRLALGFGNVIEFEKIHEDKASSIHLSLDTIIGLIKNGSDANIDELIDELHRKVQTELPGIDVVRRLCYKLTEGLSIAIQELNREKFVEMPLYQNLPGNIHYQTLFELCEIIRSTAYDLHLHLSMMNSHNLNNEALQYIMTHGLDRDFSTKVMADELHVSLSYLSRYFKHHNGQTISDYVTEQRIIEVNRMLDQDYKLSEIAEKVGYTSVNSLCRRYKQVTGMATNDYKNRVL